jgi:hypothetical protein
MLYAFALKSSLAGKKGREPLLNKLRTIIIALGILLVVAVAGVVFLQFWDPPAPSAEVEKDLPNDALQK